MVDAASSRVCANVYPPKPEWPYKTLAGIAFVLYLIIAFIPTASFIAGNIGAGLAIYALAAAVISILVFIAAVIIAARV